MGRRRSDASVARSALSCDRPIDPCEREPRVTDRTAAEEVADALREVVGRHGPNIGDDGVRLRELLTTALAGRSAQASGAEAEIDALIAAGELGIPRAIARGMSATTAATGMQGSGISAGLAIWVATAWATAVQAGGGSAPAVASTPALVATPPSAPGPAPAPAATNPTPGPAPTPAATSPATTPAVTTPVPPATTPLSAEARLRALTLPSASATSASSPTLARPGARLAPPSRPVPDPIEEPPKQREPDPTSAAAPNDSEPSLDRPSGPTVIPPAVVATAASIIEPATVVVPQERPAAEPVEAPASASTVAQDPRTTDRSVAPPNRPVPPMTPPPAVASGRVPPAEPSPSGRRWLVPAAVVAVVAIAAGAFVVTKSSKDSPSAQPTVASDTTTTGAETTAVDTPATDTAAANTSANTAAADTTAAAGLADTSSAAPTVATVGIGALPSAEGMVPIPAGTYPVGSEKPDLLAESKRRSVDVSSYFIDRHEVTNADYQAFVDDTGAAPPLTGWTASGPSDAKLDHPVRAITFEWATAYCQSRGKRLPTEVEWEVAAGGKDGVKYAWGNDLTTVTLPIDGTYPVESEAADKSSMGVFDLTGSVWEWVGDSYDPNKVGAGKHVLRGGQNGYIRNNWSRLPVDETASNAVLGAGIRCAATDADGKKALTPTFLDYTRPADPVAPAVTIPPGYKSYDDFSGSKLEWLEVNTPDFRFGYHPNKYFHLETKKPSTTVVALCPCITPTAPIGIVATGEIEPTLTEPSGTFEWGVIIRSDESPSLKETPSSYVALFVDPRNRHWRAIVHNADGKTVDIGQAQLNVEETDTVTLELRDYGTKIEYYINGTYRGESPQGVRLPKGNHAGFVLSSNSDSTKVHIHYGSFGIRSVS